MILGAWLPAIMALTSASSAPETHACAVCIFLYMPRTWQIVLIMGACILGCAYLWLGVMEHRSAHTPAVFAQRARVVGYDAHVLDQRDPARYVGLIEGGGATSLREDVSWADVEPARGRFDWSGPDLIVSQAAMHHLHVLLIIDRSPAWASGGSTSNSDWAWLPPRSPTTYGVFAAAVAARYGAGGQFWQLHPRMPQYLPVGLELWNEENVSVFWGGQPPNTKLYAAMVRAAYTSIKRADPNMIVLTGGLAAVGGYDDVTCDGQKGAGHTRSAWNGLNYLQALYDDGIHGYFDAVGWHPYNYRNGASAAQMLAYNLCSAWSQMALTPVSVRSLMAAHGDESKQVWVTEVGAPTCVPGARYSCVSPVQQAVLAAREARIWQGLNWAGGFYWYDIRDDGLGDEDGEAHFGAESWSDLPKLTYLALRRAWASVGSY